jgi:hypothetical protein
MNYGGPSTVWCSTLEDAQKIIDWRLRGREEDRGWRKVKREVVKYP